VCKASDEERGTARPERKGPDPDTSKNPSVKEYVNPVTDAGSVIYHWADNVGGQSVHGPRTWKGNQLRAGVGSSAKKERRE